MAQTRRAAKRKTGGGPDDTDIVEDVEGIEEELEQEEEDGIKLEAFNLKVGAARLSQRRAGRWAKAHTRRCSGDSHSTRRLGSWCASACSKSQARGAACSPMLDGAGYPQSACATQGLGGGVGPRQRRQAGRPGWGKTQGRPWRRCLLLPGCGSLRGAGCGTACCPAAGGAGTRLL